MEKTTTRKKEDEADDNGGSRQRIVAFEVFAISSFTLNLAAALVIILLPLRVLPPGVFPGSAERALWLLFVAGQVFGIVFYTLGAPERNKWNFSKFGGKVNLVLALVCAVEILLIRAYAPGATTSTTSLWWLFVIFTVMGGFGVYLPTRDERMKQKTREGKCKAEEKARKDQEERRRVILRSVRIKVRYLDACDKNIKLKGIGRLTTIHSTARPSLS